MNKETIAGDIRRIRAILKPDSNGLVRVNYCDLLRLFDAIETKAKAMDAEIADYEKRVAVYEEVVIENGGRIGRYDEAIRNLIDALEQASESIETMCGMERCHYRSVIDNERKVLD